MLGILHSLWEKQKNASKKGGSLSNRGYQGSKSQSEKVKAGESCVVKNIWLYVNSFLIDPRLKNSSGDVRSRIFWNPGSFFMDVVLPEEETLDLRSWVRNNNKLETFAVIPCGIPARHHHTRGDEGNGPAFRKTVRPGSDAELFLSRT